MSRVSEALRTRRVALGLSRAAMAQLSGLTEEQVQRLEWGLDLATPNTLETLAKVLRVSKQDLMPESPEPNIELTCEQSEPEAPPAAKRYRYYLSEEERSIIEAYRYLFPEDREPVVRELIDMADTARRYVAKVWR